MIIIKRYKSEKLKNKRIVFISDFHIGHNDLKRLQRIVRLVNRENPDVVISGGDYIKGNSGKNSMDIREIVKEISKIKAPIYSVLGNHDGKFDKYTIRKALKEGGINILSNSCKTFGDITIAGVEDSQTGSPNVDIALAESSFPRILVSHSPDIYYDVKEDVDLILAGHVHGGQVRFPVPLIVPSKFGTKFASGDFNETGNRMIVTKGLGTSLLTVRFNCLPEIVVIN